MSPTGTATTGCATRQAPCSLSAAASGAVAGDTVVLMDGLYDDPLLVANSGTAASPITFQADECATPIIEGPGVGPDSDDQATGVGGSEAEYLRFRGIVARGWNMGFANGWAGGTESNEVSNGFWDIEYCVSYSNGRTGFTFFSAEGFRLRYSISAHNGSSRAHSWSSGVTLFEAHGSANLVQGNVSFENTDAERNTDGSGFIVDEESNGVTFLNNVAFGNSGSCLRLTRSSGTRFINNTCYRNSQFGSTATGPTNPGEIYFTNGGVTQQGVTFMNNVIVGTGQAPAGATPVVNQPPSGWTNNVVTTGTPAYFSAPTGTNPSFVPASGDMTLTGRATSGNGAPTHDIGFDPKCLVRRTPIMVGQVARVSTWQNDIDIDYIKSIGGVEKCFNPAMRTGTPDIGAYKAGAVTTVTPGSCMPTGGTGGMGGVAGTGGMSGAGGSGGVAGGGTGGSGVAGDGMGGAAGLGGMAGDGGAPIAGAAGGLVAGAGGVGTGGASGTAGVAAGAGVGPGPSGAGGAPPGTGGSAPTAGAGAGTAAGPGSAGDVSAAEDAAGCGCRLQRSPRPAALAGFGLFFLALAARRRGRPRKN